ncbi:hypothetical protein [Mucilaginibacter sp.]|jgi:hypothetical protein|uniref:hypothetical protein n=1 Tax=Mucilaginibacter sp. TaxID=1882438 RepID=UPI002C18FEDB|nr:hypothetical protein [Mucilaginibacter sp.]HTI59463.1 hypothetical protein [Mucilaginibacter sp.]
MKNLLKIGTLALVTAGLLVACDPPSKDTVKSATPIDSSQKKIDTVKKTGIDSAKKDSVKTKN